MDDIDEAEFDAWAALSEADQDAILEREMQAYADWLESLTPVQRYAYHRRFVLQTCAGWRKTMRAIGELGVFRERLRIGQRRLAELRATRPTSAAMPAGHFAASP